MRRALPLIILAAVLMNGCSRHAPTEDIDKAAAQFFLRLKKAQYDLIYSDASPGFKQSKSQAEVKDSLEKLLATGPPQTWSRISMSFSDKDKPQVAEPGYMVLTDRMRVLVTLTFVDEGGEWKLSGFRAAPNSWGKQ
jgi:hypothetical protein